MFNPNWTSPCTHLDSPTGSHTFNYQVQRRFNDLLSTCWKFFLTRQNLAGANRCALRTTLPPLSMDVSVLSRSHVVQELHTPCILPSWVPFRSHACHRSHLSQRSLAAHDANLKCNSNSHYKDDICSAPTSHKVLPCTVQPAGIV